MDMPPEVVEQLLDDGPKCSSFRFLLSFDRSGAANFFVPLSMVHDDGGLCCNAFWKIFLQESEKDCDRVMNVSIGPFTRLI